MYARSTTVRGDPGAVDAGIGFVRDEVWPMVRGMDGCIGLSMLVDRPAGCSIIVTAWDSERTLMASAEAVRASRSQAAEVMRADRMDLADWEIVRLHRRHPAVDGACVRVTWTEGDRAALDRSLDTFGMAILPRLDDLPGFCSVSQLVDRRAGRSVLAACYDSRDALESSSDQVAGMRREFTDDTGVRVTEVAVFDLAVAHLHVPETV
jgi:hypothetical protein